MESEEQAIRETHAAWVAAVNTPGLARLQAMMTDDVVFLGPGQAPFGRDGFHDGFLAGHAQYRIQCLSDLQEVVVVGDVAYARARDTLTLVPRQGGATVRMAGDRLTVYRRRADGRWLLARDAHTLVTVA